MDGCYSSLVGRPIPRLLKIRILLVGTNPWVRRDRRAHHRVGVRKSDKLVAVRVILRKTSSDRLEGSSEKHVVRGVGHDLNLEVDVDVSKAEANVFEATVTTCYLRVCGFHLYGAVELEVEPKESPYGFLHGDDLRTGVYNAFTSKLSFDQRVDSA
jgi:hypothetical protein